MEKLLWEDVKGYEGLYQVSNTGIIKTVGKVDRQGRIKKEKIKSVTCNSRGYYMVNLCKDGKCKLSFVHRLVAKAFLPDIEGKEIVNHKDRNIKNNHVSNLEYVTHSENTLHAIGGASHHKAILSDEDVKWIRENYVKGSRTLGSGALSKRFGVSATTIYNYVNGVHRVLD